MTADKRSVATDALEVLGTVIKNKKVGRDAVHLACLPVLVADSFVTPGQHVGILPNGRASAHATPLLGIIDPFLTAPAKMGEEVLLIIYPRKIESLRHVWSHPQIQDEPLTRVVETQTSPSPTLIAAVEKAERLYSLQEEFKSIANRLLDNHDDAAALLTDGMRNGYIQDGDAFEGWDTPKIPVRAWELYEMIHGHRASYDPRDGKADDSVYFSCSC